MFKCGCPSGCTPITTRPCKPSMRMWPQRRSTEENPRPTGDGFFAESGRGWPGCPNFVLSQPGVSLRQWSGAQPVVSIEGRTGRRHYCGGARLMGERRRRTMGERGAPRDPVSDIVYGVPLPPRDAASEWLEQAGKPNLCSCGLELPVTGMCGFCD
jgi:hypothetical protein